MNKLRKKRVIKLYDYQGVAYRKVVKALVLTARALMVMATGLGKTIVAAFVAKRFMKKKDDTLLFLCHDTGILDQAYSIFKEMLGERFTYTKFYGGRKDWNADDHNFVFATFQSMQAHLEDKKRKNIFSRRHFKYVIVDESHHSEADTYAPVIHYFISLWKLGMTATPDREDAKDIRKIFGNEVVNYPLAEGIAKGWLTPVDYRVLADGIDTEALRELCRQVNDEGLRITKEDINKKVFVRLRTKKQCNIIRRDTLGGQKAIVFCRNIEHLRHVASLLPSSVMMHSNQSNEANAESLRKFKNGKARHMLVVDKFNEGMDVPNTRFLNFLRATKSRRIFLQQLGRGLRKSSGKKKLIVRDFVANIDRIQEVQQLMLEIQEFVSNGSKKRENSPFDPFHVEGTGFKFDFTQNVRDLLIVLEKSTKSFYLTWEESSKVAISFGIKSRSLYKKMYKLDPRLPAHPDRFYTDFPGWYKFLGINKTITVRTSEIYKTWKVASKAAKALGASSDYSYRKIYKKDPKLPAHPDRYYKDFPGLSVFLGIKFVKRVVNVKYKTWKEASNACKKIGIKTGNREYRRRYSEDSKLPSSPHRFYTDFPGWYKFLGKEVIEKKDSYKTWEEASRVCINAGVPSGSFYRKHYKEISAHLPGRPEGVYKNFPGWSKFLGKK